MATLPTQANFPTMGIIPVLVMDSASQERTEIYADGRWYARIVRKPASHLWYVQTENDGLRRDWAVVTGFNSRSHAVRFVLDHYVYPQYRTTQTTVQTIA